MIEEILSVTCHGNLSKKKIDLELWLATEGLGQHFLLYKYNFTFTWTEVSKHEDILALQKMKCYCQRMITRYRGPKILI